MGVDGENLQGVFGGNQLLEKKLHPNYQGKKVAVIGGGNVAMDCARTIKRLGAEEVDVIYRRAEEQMPAEAKEHWEDELSLTSEQLTAYMEQELEKKSDIIKTFKSVSVDEQEELSIDRIQNFNENYLGEVGIKADEAVRCICTIYDDTGHIDDYRVTVYQYKGKWYSHSADAFFE